MHLSTSNSNQRLPHGPWVKVWGLTAAAVLSVLLFWECFWRARGYTPMVQDSQRAWAMERAKVNDSAGQVVLCGASRIQLGIDTEVFDRNFPGPKPIELAIDGMESIPVLLNLAEGSQFRGILISAMNGSWIGLMNRRSWSKAREYINEYETLSPGDYTENFLVSTVQRSLVMVLPHVNPKHVFRRLMEGKWPQRQYLVNMPDRSRRADYSLHFNLEGTRKRRREKVREMQNDLVEIPAREIESNMERLRGAVSRIQGRGGRVVFVYLPVTGPSKEYDYKNFPRELYWDRLADMTGALTIHFEDYPELSGFDCPDYSHLNHDQAVIFTRNLARLLDRKLFKEGLRQAKTE